MYNIGYHGDQGRTYQSWEQQKQTPCDTNRVWVEISDDEDMCLDRTLFQDSSGKPHPTPPLDLSALDKPGRHVESPLDLSVKTRKRCADSTEFDEQHFAHGQHSKRMCLPQSGENNMYNDYTMGNLKPVNRMRYSEESEIKHKIMPGTHSKPVAQKTPYSATVPSPLVQTSPLPYPQQPPFSNVRSQQHQPSRLKQMSQAPITKLATKLPQSIPAPHVTQYPPQMVAQQPMLKHQQQYDKYAMQPAVSNRTIPPKPKLTSETTALQGFYEPSQKHTLTVRGNLQSTELGGGSVGRERSVESRIVDPRTGSHGYGRGSVGEHVHAERTALNVQRAPPSLAPSATYPPGGRATLSATSSRRSYDQAQIGSIQQQQHQTQQQQLRHQMIIRESRDINRANRIVPSPRGPGYGPIAKSQTEPLLTAQDRECMAQVMNQYRSNNRSHMMTYQTPSPQQLPQSPPLLQQQQLVFHTDAQKSPTRQSRNFNAVRDIRQSQMHRVDLARRDVAMATTMSDMQTQLELRPRHGLGVGPSDVDLQRNYQQASSNPESIRRGYNVTYGSASQTMSLYPKEAKHAGPRLENRLQRTDTVQLPMDYPMPGSGISSANRIRDNKSVSSIIPGGQPSIQTEQLIQHSVYPTAEHKNQRADRGSITIENLLAESLISNVTSRNSTPGYLITNQNRSNNMTIHPRPAQQESRVVDSQRMSNVDSKQAQTINVQSSYAPNRQPHTDQASSRPVVGRRSPGRRSSSDVARPASTASSGSIRKTPDIISTKGRSLMSNIMFPAMTGSNKLDHGRSIMAGTSGAKTNKLDAFDAFVLDELRKDIDDSDNVFKNTSVLQAFDKSANPSPCVVTEHESVENDAKSVPADAVLQKRSVLDNAECNSDGSYVLPLHIAIPGSKLAQRDSVITTAIQDQSSNSNPKVWSRKHMILSAYKHDKDLNTVVNIDNNERIPVASSKFITPKRTEKDNTNPPSPKMPILSPEEQKRHTPLVSPAPTDPPTLESTTNSNRPVPKSTTKEINSLEEQLHKMISDAVKGQGSFDKSMCETVYREFASQPQVHKPFLSRQTSQSKHIPVANVAPMVHARFVNDSKATLQDGEVKTETTLEQFDNEDNKHEQLETQHDKESDDVATRVVTDEDTISGTDSTTPVRKTFDVYKAIDIAMQDDDSKSSDERSVPYKTDFPTTSVVENSEANNYFISSNAQQQLEDEQFRIGDGNNNDKPGVSSEYSEYNPMAVYATNRRCSRTDHKDTETDRNVFGAFNELLAQRRVSMEQMESAVTETSDTNGHAQLSKDGYEGDDEDRAERQLAKKKQSNVRQKADKLIRKAKQTKSQSTDGSDNLHSGPLRRLSHGSQGKGFPGRRSRSNSKSLQCSPTNRRQSVVDENAIPEDVKSDNEVFKNDESTDEEYFQNYEDEFKQFLRKQGTSDSTPVKKTPAPKKKKGLQFQLKYFSQRKKKAKGKKSQTPVAQRSGPVVPSCSNTLYDFEDEEFPAHGTAPKALPGRLPLGIAYSHEMPIPPELRRLAVNKDTGETLLHKAARMGYQEVVLYCLTTESVDVNARDNAGYTPLHECAVTGHVSIARHLLGHGADVNVCSIDGIRPIHDAVEYDRLELLRLLLSFGADPTLSTYAGKSLVKIARTDRMRKFLNRYLADANGCKSDSEAAAPWQFRASSTLIEPEIGLGCAIFTELPSDPEDETTDLCTLSAKPLFPTQRITADGGKRVEDYILLDDILKGYKVTRSEVEGHIPSLMLKTIGKETFLDSNKNSVSIEKYTTRASSLVEGAGFSAIRQVDSAQIISKIDKRVSASKRSKL